MLGRSSRRHDHQLVSWTQADGGSHFLPYPFFPVPKAAPRMQPWDHLDGVRDWILSRFGRWEQETYLAVLKTSVLSKFPCSLELLYTHLQWSTSLQSLRSLLWGPVYEPTSCEPAWRPKMSFGKEASEGDILCWPWNCVGRGGPCVRCLWTTVWVWRRPKNTSCFNGLLWGTMQSTLGSSSGQRCLTRGGNPG